MSPREGYVRSASANRDQPTLCEFQPVKRKPLNVFFLCFSQQDVDELQAMGGQNDLDAASDRRQDRTGRLTHRPGC